MIHELMEYTLSRIKSYRDEKNQDYIFGQCSPRLHGNSTEGSIEIRAPKRYHGKKRLERRIKTAVGEFYLKNGFKITETDAKNNRSALHFEKGISFLEKYLISIERQGRFFYIHISHN